MQNKIKIREQADYGPWLLSEETLIKIDTIMIKAYDDFIAFEDISNTTQNKKYYYKKLTIYYKNEINVSYKSFKEAIVSEDISLLKPIKFEYIIEVDNNKFYIELNSEKDYFQYYIYCKNDEIEDNLIYEMKNIYIKEKPKKIFSIFSRIGLWSWLINICILSIMANVISNVNNTPIQKHIENKIYQLLIKEEISDDDYKDIIKYITEAFPKPLTKKSQILQSRQTKDSGEKNE